MSNAEPAKLAFKILCGEVYQRGLYMEGVPVGSQTKTPHDTF